MLDVQCQVKFTVVKTDQTPLKQEDAPKTVKLMVDLDLNYMDHVAA